MVFLLSFFQLRGSSKFFFFQILLSSKFSLLFNIKTVIKFHPIIHRSSHHSWLRSAHLSPKDRRISRSGSVPNLTSCNRSPTIAKQNSISPTAQRIRQHHHRSSKKERLVRNIRGIQRNNMGKSIDECGVYFTSAKPSNETQNSAGERNFFIFYF